MVTLYIVHHLTLIFLLFYILQGSFLMNLRRFITPLGVLGYEELKYNLIDWYGDFFVAEYTSQDGQSNHHIRMNLNIGLINIPSRY